MSPELFQNKPYNHKSDTWALGTAGPQCIRPATATASNVTDSAIGFVRRQPFCRYACRLLLFVRLRDGEAGSVDRCRWSEMLRRLCPVRNDDQETSFRGTGHQRADEEGPDWSRQALPCLAFRSAGNAFLNAERCAMGAAPRWLNQLALAVGHL